MLQKKKTIWIQLLAMMVMTAIMAPALLGCSTVVKDTEDRGPIAALPMELVVKITDLDGDDWDWISSLPVPEYGAEHAYQVEFSRKIKTSNGEERVFCKIAVYSSEDEANTAFASVKERSTPSARPDIGEEAFIDTGPVINGTGLVFRKFNAVAWIWVNHEYEGDILQLGNVINERISHNISERETS